MQDFETNNIDYLLKPSKQERLAKIISKLAEFTPLFNKAEILDFLKAIEKEEAKPKRTSIHINTGGRSAIGAKFTTT